MPKQPNKRSKTSQPKGESRTPSGQSSGPGASGTPQGKSSGRTFVSLLKPTETSTRGRVAGIQGNGKLLQEHFGGAVTHVSFGPEAESLQRSMRGETPTSNETESSTEGDETRKPSTPGPPEAPDSSSEPEEFSSDSEE
jgi:hypothetical protein